MLSVLWSCFQLYIIIMRHIWPILLWLAQRKLFSKENLYLLYNPYDVSCHNLPEGLIVMWSSSTENNISVNSCPEHSNLKNCLLMFCGVSQIRHHVHATAMSRGRKSSTFFFVIREQVGDQTTYLYSLKIEKLKLHRC